MTNLPENREKAYAKLTTRLQIIADMVMGGASVLDVGCGRGELLHYLCEYRYAVARGIDISQNKTSSAIARGLSVVQGDMNLDLQYYPDKSYDYVICAGALQATHDPKGTLEELARIGKKIIISVPNFGYWKNRFQLGVSGHMPVTEKLSYQWYETPNIHFCTLNDFVDLCDEVHLNIIKSQAIYADGSYKTFTKKSLLPNLLGEEGIFLMQK